MQDVGRDIPYCEVWKKKILRSGRRRFKEFYLLPEGKKASGRVSACLRRYPQGIPLRGAEGEAEAGRNRNQSRQDASAPGNISGRRCLQVSVRLALESLLEGALLLAGWF
jgi:hypothetical protein